MGRIAIEMAGKRFGHWLVLSRAPQNRSSYGRQALWNCRCDCGAERVVAGSELRSGRSTNCGCWKHKDRIGEKHGLLTVLSRYPGLHEKGPTKWLCRCDCGNEIVVNDSPLVSGNTRSCGCLKYKNVYKLPRGESAFNSMYARMEGGAIKRGKEWSLTKDQVRKLTEQNCHYCGTPPAQICNPKDCNGSYVYNGVDRINNNRGYVIDNVVACCGACNNAKRTMGYTEFKDWVTKVYEHFVAQLSSH